MGGFIWSLVCEEEAGNQAVKRFKNNSTLDGKL